MVLVAVSRTGWFPDNSAMTVVTPCLSRSTGVIARSANQRRLWPGCCALIGWPWLQVESMFIINGGVTMVPAACPLPGHIPRRQMAACQHMDTRHCIPFTEGTERLNDDYDVL